MSVAAAVLAGEGESGGGEPTDGARSGTTQTDACHVALVGDVSGLRALRLEAQLVAVGATIDRLVVNLSRVTHLSPDALRSLARARAQVLGRYGQFHLHGASPAAAKALARAGLRWPADCPCRRRG